MLRNGTHFGLSSGHVFRWLGLQLFPQTFGGVHFFSFPQPFLVELVSEHPLLGDHGTSLCSSNFKLHSTDSVFADQRVVELQVARGAENSLLLELLKGGPGILVEWFVDVGQH